MRFVTSSLVACACSLATYAAENVASIGGAAIANVASVGGVAEANIASIGGIDNTAAGGVSTAFSDNFNRADGAGLGANWTAVASAFNVDTNTAVSSAAGTTIMAVPTTSASSANQWARVVINTADTNYAAVVLRYTNGSSPLYAVWVNKPSGIVEWTRQATPGVDQATIASTSLTTA